jgi:hypothetical protein
MERRRPNRQLKNSEDVQGALIEEYFRYDDLSRMEAEAISMINVCSGERKSTINCYLNSP